MPNDNYIPIIRGLSANDYYVGAEAGAFNLYSPGVGSFIAYCAFIWRGTGQVYSGGASSPPVPQYIWGNYSDGYGAGPRGWALSIEAVDGYAVLRATMADATGAIVTADLPLTGGNSQGNPFGHLMFASVTVTATTLFLTLNGAIAAASPVAALLGAAPNPPRLGCNPFDASDPAINIDVIGCGHTALSFTDANVGESADTTFRSFLAGFGQSSVGPADGINWNHRYTVDGQALPSTVVKNSAGAYVTALGVGPATLVDHGNDSPNPGLVVPGLTAVALNRVGSPTVTSNRAPQFYGSRTFDSLSPAPTPPASATIIDIYVSPALGDDSNPGTQAAPLATLDAAESRIPNVVSDTYRIHLRAENYPLPTNRDVWFRSRTLQGGDVLLFADEAWDATVYTSQVAQVAQAGTGAAVVVGAGLVANAQRYRTIRMLDGAAAGQYRRINSNDATNILPDAPFNPAPAPGDNFEIITLNTQITLNPNFSAVTVEGTLGGTPTSAFPSFLTGSLHGIEFRGLTFSGFNLNRMNGAPIILTGVDFADNAGFHMENGCVVLSGLGNDALLKGWGFRNNNGVSVQISGSSVFVGYVHSSGGSGFGIYNGGLLTVYGGAIFRTLGAFGSFSNALIGVDGDATTPFIVDQNGGGSAGIDLSDTDRPGRRLEIANSNIRGNIIVHGDAVLVLHSTAVGTAPQGVDVSGSARVLCIGAPVYGDGAANDWVVQGVAAFNKAALAAVNSAVVGTDGSLATRAS